MGRRGLARKQMCEQRFAGSEGAGRAGVGGRMYQVENSKHREAGHVEGTGGSLCGWSRVGKAADDARDGEVAAHAGPWL